MSQVSLERSAHLDTFARDHLPPAELWPTFVGLEALGYPPRLNCAAFLLERALAAGAGDRVALIGERERWSYRELAARVDAIAAALVADLGLVPGGRVLLRAPNEPRMVACWLAVVKAGGIAVSTMPLLRARELATIIDKAEVGLALCDERLLAELEAAAGRAPRLERICPFGEDGELERLAAARAGTFRACDTAADDVCLIAFTSGTTGVPKGTCHFHRDVLAICDTFSARVLRPRPEDRFTGSPPLAFTFGLGGLALFPLHAGAASVLVEQPTPDHLAEAIERHRASVLFTAPTGYRTILDAPGVAGLGTLRRCVSAGETLPRPVFEAWREATGLAIIDGIGTTEMLHMFISSADEAIRPGATGRVVPGYQARVLDAEGHELPPGEVGRLAVRGPTGCRYLADERQRDYVVDGWNVTGDTYRVDEDGYFWFQARNDDMIISAGYNIAGPEVEEALLGHPAVAECAVVGAPDERRGQVVKAYVVPRAGVSADEALARALQEHVKATIAPYKYPRAVAFVEGLPRTETGKVQRFRLRQQAAREAAEAEESKP